MVDVTRTASDESAANAPATDPTNQINIRLHAMLVLLASAMLVGMLLTPKLWLSTRDFPLAPVSDSLPEIPTLFGWLVFGTLLIFLGTMLVLPRYASLLIFTFVLLAVLWSLWDQTRWQPWFYQYLAMFIAVGLAYWQPAAERQEGCLNTCRLIMACMYIWSGIQKINFTFATIYFPWMMEPIANQLGDAPKTWLLDQGWNAAYAEVAIGVCLILWPLRYAAGVLAVAMHGLILVCLIGHNWNTAVWPWNIAMIGFVLILFAGRSAPHRIVWPKQFLFARVALVLFGIMPLLSFWGFWDAYLSASLYSGNTLNSRLYITQEVKESLPKFVQQKFVTPRDLQHLDVEAVPWLYKLDEFSWGMEELNVPLPPERRLMRNIAQRLCSGANQPGGVALIVLERPHWRTGKRKKTREKLADVGGVP